MIPTYRQAAQEVLKEELDEEYLASNTAHFVYEFEPNELDKPLFRELLHLMIYEHTDPINELLYYATNTLRRNTMLLVMSTIANIVLSISIIVLLRGSI